MDRTGKTRSDIRASKLRQILNFSPEAEYEEGNEQEHSQVSAQRLPLSVIRLPATQPRRYFDDKKLEELAASIKEHGILENLLVRPLADGEYELVAGERRYRAAKMLGLADVPITIRELTEHQALEIALVENLQREDLNPIEETEGILQLLSIRLGINVESIPPLLYKMQHEAKGRIAQNVLGNEGQIIQEVFQALGVISWESFTSSRLPLLNLPQDILDTLRKGGIAYTKAQAIARIKDEEQRQALLEEAIAEDLSLAQIRERIKEVRPPALEGSQTLKLRLRNASQRLQKAKFWDNPQKQKQIEKLLAQMEALLLDESV